MARKESVGSLDETFHEDPIPGLITGMDDNCYEINLVTAGGRTMSSPLDDDVEVLTVDEVDDDPERVESHFAACEMLDMSSLWEELEGLGVRTDDIDEFMLRFGSSPPPLNKDAYWDSGVESDFFTLTDDGSGGADEDDSANAQRGELYQALKRGGLLPNLQRANSTSPTKRDTNLKAFLETKLDRIRKWRASLKAGLNIILRVASCASSINSCQPCCLTRSLRDSADWLVWGNEDVKCILEHPVHAWGFLWRREICCTT